MKNTNANMEVIADKQTYIFFFTGTYTPMKLCYCSLTFQLIIVPIYIDNLVVYEYM